MQEELSENIKRIRRLKGLSQEKLAGKLHISAQAYSKIENGETKLSFDRLGQIAQAMDVDPLDLLRFDERQVFNHCNQEGNFANSIITESFGNERKIYEARIRELKEQLEFLKSRLAEEGKAK